MLPPQNVEQKADSKRQGPLSPETAAALAGSGPGSGSGSAYVPVADHRTSPTALPHQQLSSFLGLNVDINAFAHMFVSQSRRQPHVLSLAASSLTHASP